VAGLALALWRGRRRRQNGAPRGGLLGAYARLQETAGRLGAAPRPGQTPAEFAAVLQAHLAQLGRRRLGRWLGVERALPALADLSQSYIERRYAGRPGSEAAALAAWRRVRLRLVLLAVGRRLGLG
ncbi:MAG: DUF4129 domain-containing protein, partial [Candidatus Promineifilaceae bacterium]